MLPMIHCLSADTLFGSCFVAVRELPVGAHGCFSGEINGAGAYSCCLYIAIEAYRFKSYVVRQLVKRHIYTTLF